MELSIYTNALETAVQQMLSQVYHIAEYQDRVVCQVSLNPEYKVMFYEIRLTRLLPRNKPGSRQWAQDLYNRLRLFPGGRGLTIKFDEPKSYWTFTHFGHTGYSTPSPKTWDNIDKHGGFCIDMNGSIDAPANASDFITVRLNWIFKPEGGTSVNGI